MRVRARVSIAIAVGLGCLLHAVAGGQDDGPKVKIFLNPSAAAGPGKIQRGEDFVLVGGPFAKPDYLNKATFTPAPKIKAQAAKGPGVAKQGRGFSKQAVPSTSKLAIDKTVVLKAPLNIANGKYRLKVDIPEVGASNMIEVEVVDPPIRVKHFGGTSNIAGTISFGVNWAPANSKVVVTREQAAPFHEEYWGTYKSVGAKTSVLKPTIKPGAYGLTSVSAKLPKSLGAGHFRCRIVAEGVNPTEYQAFDITPPASKRAQYTIKFDGLKCLTETDEAGADEPYSILLSGLLGGHMTARLGGPHGDVDEGEHHPWDVILFDKKEIAKAEEILIVVGLVENDDGIPQSHIHGLNKFVGATRAPYYYYEPPRQAQAIAEYVEIIAQSIRGEISHQNFNGVDNDDDIVGMGALGFTADELKACRFSPGWRQKSIQIAGDGGRYELYFSIMAEPSKF